jgi:hypothetical protein
MYDYYLGGCDQPAPACEVHHLTHKADGGKTSVTDCACPGSSSGTGIRPS